MASFQSYIMESNSRKLGLLALFAITLALFASSAYGHALKTDGKIGILMHIDPNDEPYAKEKSTIFVEVKNIAKKSAVPCDCSLTIKKEGMEINKFTVLSKSDSDHVDVFFPDSGVFKLLVEGNSSEGLHFSTEFDYYVRSGHDSNSSNANNGKSSIGSNGLSRYFAYASIAGGLIILLMFYNSKFY